MIQSRTSTFAACDVYQGPFEINVERRQHGFRLFPHSFVWSEINEGIDKRTEQASKININHHVSHHQGSSLISLPPTSNHCCKTPLWTKHINTHTQNNKQTKQTNKIHLTFVYLWHSVNFHCMQLTSAFLVPWSLFTVQWRTGSLLLLLLLNNFINDCRTKTDTKKE